MDNQPSEQFERGIEKLAREANERRAAGRERYAAQDWDLCILCHAYGADKRSLFIECWYAIDEVVPEVMNISECGIKDHSDGYHLRICKSCRGRFLTFLKAWADFSRSFRGAAKNHDGVVEDDSSRNIPVRINGAVVMMSMEEYQHYAGIPWPEEI